MKHFKTLFFCIMVLCFSCETEQVETSNLDSTVTLESVRSQIEIENAISAADDALDNLAIYTNIDFFGNVGKSATLNGAKNPATTKPNFFRNCVDIMTITNEGSRTIVFTFTGECEDQDGNVITGVVTKTTTYGDEDKQTILTIENLTINGLIINGTKTQNSVASNQNGNPEISGTVDLSVETENGTITRVGNRTVALIEGGDTRTFQDDVKSITGSFTYTGLERNFSTEITSPLIKPANCRFIVSGTKKYITDEEETTLDYGDGTCDEFATLTLPDGTQTEISLKKSRNKSDNDSGDEDGDDEMNTSRCVITTDCEEVTLENISNLSITVNQVDGAYLIVAKNGEGETVYEAECDQGPNVSVSCSSQSSGEDNDDSEDEEDNDEDGENEDEDEDDEGDMDEDDNGTDVKQCTITTECEEVVIENTSELKIEVTQSGDLFIIVAENQEGEIVYQAECSEGPEVTVNCTSETDNDDDDEQDDADGDNDDEEGEENDDSEEEDEDEGGDNDEDEENSDDEEDNEDEDEMGTGTCTITTLCEEVVIENTSVITLEVTTANGVFVIVGKNEEGEVVYEGTCDLGGDASVECSS